MLAVQETIGVSGVRGKMLAVQETISKQASSNRISNTHFLVFGGSPSHRGNEPATRGSGEYHC